MDSFEDRMGKRLAEIREQEQALDREIAEREARETDLEAAVVQRRKDGFLGPFLFTLGVLALAAGLLGLAITVNRWAGEDMGDARRTGQATVSRCAERGPVTNRGFGYWESCEARITWADADLEAATVGDVFTSADIGTTVTVGDLGRHRGDLLLARADEKRRPWLAWLSYGITIIALVPGLVGVLFMKELLRFRKK
jgi:hypothetical protein